MKFKVVAIGKRMPKWVQLATEEYIKRFPSNLSLDLVELPLCQEKNISDDRVMEKEGKLILAAVKQDTVIALDKSGKSLDSEQFARWFATLIEGGRPVSFVIGGPIGLSKECLNHASHKLSLSKCTLPHPLARLVLIEQLYRAQCILTNHPYHK